MLSGQIPSKLLQVLGQAIAEQGAAAAIDACRIQAPELARAASERSGWQVRRASLKPRHPAAAPDAWERARLEQFEARLAAGVSPQDLEYAEIVVMEGRSTFRYAKALPTGALCLQCHGPRDTLSQAVREQLDAHYPSDQATGYSAGQLRGALFLTKPL
jgi:Protein of unknown function (DUF3365)